MLQPSHRLPGIPAGRGAIPHGRWTFRLHIGQNIHDRGSSSRTSWWGGPCPSAFETRVTMKIRTIALAGVAALALCGPAAASDATGGGRGVGAGWGPLGNLNKNGRGTLCTPV